VRLRRRRRRRRAFYIDWSFEWSAAIWVRGTLGVAVKEDTNELEFRKEDPGGSWRRCWLQSGVVVDVKDASCWWLL
jgi:hypothetical protein